jgi:hypothetical protein
MKIQAKRLIMNVQLGTPLIGWPNIARQCKKIDGELEANILLLTSDERIIILIAMDTLFGARWLENHLENTLSHACKGAPIHVITIGTHTHFAPGLDRNKPVIGAVDLQWQSNLADQLTAMLNEMLGRLDGSAACSIQVATDQIPMSVSRRKRWPWPLLSRKTILRLPKVVMAPNYSNAIDQTAAIAIIKDSGENPICILVNWAAHPTIYPDPYAASAEYIGIIRTEIRKKFAADIPILFLQGFAGDVRPIPPHNRISWKSLLLYGPQFVPFNGSQWQQFGQKLSAYFIKMLGTATPDAPPFLTPHFAQSSCALAELIEGDNDERDISFRHVAISKTLGFVFVPAEPSSAFTQIVRSDFPNAWPVGYSGDVFGYWPTDAQAQEGGYEAEGFFPLFGLHGKFFGRNEAVFKDLLSRLKN